MRFITTMNHLLTSAYLAISSMKSTSSFKDRLRAKLRSSELFFVPSQSRLASSVAAAFRATFDRRGTAIPSEFSASFGSDFAIDGQRGWNAFVRRLTRGEEQSFAALLIEIEPFVMRIAAMAGGEEAEADWAPRSSWTESGLGLRR